MESLDVRINLRENPWSDYPEDTPQGKIARIGFVPEATDAGKPTVGIAIEFENGDVVVGETTMALFVTAARAGLARYGEPG